jgi:hypothetical protein
LSKACAERLKASNGGVFSCFLWGFSKVIADTATPAQQWLLGLQQIQSRSGRWCLVIFTTN